MWQAAKLFNGERSPLVVPFVRQRVTQVLQGKVETVIRGLRRLATERKLSAAKKKSLSRICRYLSKNRHRMHYHDYLAKGYPIASGVIEGACRHLVKDRLETGAGIALDDTGGPSHAECSQRPPERPVGSVSAIPH